MVDGEPAVDLGERCEHEWAECVAEVGGCCEGDESG